MLSKGFAVFTSGRKIVCYSGVAPIEHTSGMGIKGKTRVGHLVNKKMKSLLHMISLTAIKHVADLGDYCMRK